MNVLWLSWKDRSHPLAGGAETVSGEIMDRFVKDGHEVIHLTASYPQATPHETTVSGVEIYRQGNRYSVYLKVRQLFKQRFQEWPDVVIDEMNTLPFGNGFYSHKKNVMVCYQLAREVWLYQMPPPISWIGYITEPLMLHFIAKTYPLTLTESKSSQKDLINHGFKNVQTFRVGIALQPLPSLTKKQPSNIVLSLGSIRPMKQTLHAVKAFEVARDKNPALRMIIAGDNTGDYAEQVIGYIAASRHKGAIEVLGRISASKRLELMQQADVIIVTSIKEGWGLIVTEANSQGTPAIGYDADGLRDSIQDGVTGLLAPNGDYEAMGNQIVTLLGDQEQYSRLREAAWQWSKEFTFDNSYADFLATLRSEKIIES